MHWTFHVIRYFKARERVIVEFAKIFWLDGRGNLEMRKNGT